MVSLYYILILDNNDEESTGLKALMYALLYMDNGAITAADTETLKWAYSKLNEIFNPYKFEVQQLITNDIELQRKIDADFDVDTPVATKLFGLTWDRLQDEIYTKPIDLNSNAVTKRTILQTIAGQFDIYGFNMPLFNRCRLYMHRLQCQKKLGWDQKLPEELTNEWKNICKQANSSPVIKINRFVGPRDGTFKLIAFTDASHVLYGAVIYLQHVESGRLSFVQAKNRMVNNQLKSKSVLSLELNAISLGVETLMEIHRDLAGTSCVKPICITEMCVFTDSLCSLHWLNAFSSKTDEL